MRMSECVLNHVRRPPTPSLACMFGMICGKRDIDHAIDYPCAYHSAGSTELSARIAKLEPIAERVDELEAALLAHAKSNKEKFDVCIRCTR